MGRSSSGRGQKTQYLLVRNRKKSLTLGLGETAQLTPTRNRPGQVRLVFPKFSQRPPLPTPHQGAPVGYSSQGGCSGGSLGQGLQRAGGLEAAPHRVVWGQSRKLRTWPCREHGASPGCCMDWRGALALPPPAVTILQIRKMSTSR